MKKEYGFVISRKKSFFGYDTLESMPLKVQNTFHNLYPKNSIYTEQIPSLIKKNYFSPYCTKGLDLNILRSWITYSYKKDNKISTEEVNFSIRDPYSYTYLASLGPVYSWYEIFRAAANLISNPEKLEYGIIPIDEFKDCIKSVIGSLDSFSLEEKEKYTGLLLYTVDYINTNYLPAYFVLTESFHPQTIELNGTIYGYAKGDDD